MDKEIIGSCKFNGEIYMIKPTGKVISKEGKHYVDFNGYDTYREPYKREQIGLYNSNNEFCYTIDAMNKISVMGKVVATVTIKEPDFYNSKTQTNG